MKQRIERAVQIIMQPVLLTSRSNKNRVKIVSEMSSTCDNNYSLNHHSMLKFKKKVISNYFLNDKIHIVKFPFSIRVDCTVNSLKKKMTKCEYLVCIQYLGFMELP